MVSNTLPTVNPVDPLRFGVVWQLGAQEIAWEEWRMEANKYEEILEATVWCPVQTLKLKKDWVFQQDNENH